jgi:hypothetical protein
METIWERQMCFFAKEAKRHECIWQERFFTMRAAIILFYAQIE